jgi:hypothetical protein
MRPLHLVLGAGVVIAAGLAKFGDKTPDGIAAPVARSPARAGAVSAAPAAAPRVNADAPRAGAAAPAVYALIARADLVGDGTAAEGEAVFGSQNWNPPPPPPMPAPPPPPPSAPPLPFSVLGKSVSEGRWEVFLARGERTFVVHNQDVIDGTYRVDAIAPPVLSLTYLPLNQVQQLNIGVLD